MENLTEEEFETIKKGIIEQIKGIEFEYTTDFNDTNTPNGHGERTHQHTRETLLQEIEEYILTRFK